MDTSRPVIPVAIEHSETDILIHSDGTKRSAANITFSPEDIGAMKAGYICVRCFERQREAWPEHCPVCQFPISDKQAEFFAKAFVGEVWVGPRTTHDEEMAIAREMLERERARPPSILVPRGY